MAGVDGLTKVASTRPGPQFHNLVESTAVVESVTDYDYLSCTDSNRILVSPTWIRTPDLLNLAQ